MSYRTDALRGIRSPSSFPLAKVPSSIFAAHQIIPRTRQCSSTPPPISQFPFSHCRGGRETLSRDVPSGAFADHPPCILPPSLAPVHRSIKCVPRSPGRPCKAQIERSGKLQKQQMTRTRERANGGTVATGGLSIHFRPSTSPESDPLECFFALLSSSLSLPEDCELSEWRRWGADIKGAQGQKSLLGFF